MAKEIWKRDSVRIANNPLHSLFHPPSDRCHNSGSNNSSNNPGGSGCSWALSSLSTEDPIAGTVSWFPVGNKGRRTWAEQPFEDALSFEGWKKYWGQRDRWLLMWHRRKGSKAEVKRFTGCQEKTGDWINRGSFSLSSYESYESWNYLEYFTYYYFIAFIFHLFTSLL